MIKQGNIVREINLKDRSDFISLHRQNSDRYPFLLESAAHGTPQGRHDILFAFPLQTLLLDENRILHFPDGKTQENGDFLKNLDDLWKQNNNLSTNPSLTLPFQGGWFIFLSYELVSQIEDKLSEIELRKNLPIAYAVRIPLALIHDHALDKTFLVVEKGFESLANQVDSDLASLSDASNYSLPLSEEIIEDDPAAFISSVEKTLDYIYEGDVFQANLSREYRGTLKPEVDYLQLYTSLREQNPSPFAALAFFQGQALCSSSPERLVRKLNGRVEMRPIAGTRPRGSEQGEDKKLSEDLLGNAKEQAEHIMLIDLIRNDLGRVCRYDSIHLDEDRVIESYAHVHHIVSNVAGEARPGVTPGEVIRAVFPGGTITGCPKVRCMEIISEQEQCGRGAYTGSVGYLNHNGDFDLNILIRTIVCEGDEFHFRAGAGIVSDSIPENELKETRHKAKGLVRALGGS